MDETRTVPRPLLDQSLLFGLFFLFFFQLLTDFIAALYAFGLMGLNIPPEIVCVGLLFSPLLLIFFKKNIGARWLAGLAILALVCRTVEPVLPTRERMLVAGVGVAALLVLFAGGLTRSGVAQSNQRKPGWGLALGVGMAGLLRALGGGVDPSTAWMGNVGMFLLPVLAGWQFTLYLRLGSSQPPAGIERTNPQAGSIARIAGLGVGIGGAVGLLYLAFIAPNVIARWTQTSPVWVFGLASAALIGYFVLFRSRGKLGARLGSRAILLWNVLFIMALTSTLFLQQISFPVDANAFPYFPPAPPAWGVLPLVFTLLLFPVILLDFDLYTRQIRAWGPTPRQVGVGLTAGCLFLMVLIFAHVFTTVYDYIPVIGPLFRGRFGLVYLAAGLGMILPLGRVDWAPIAPAANPIELRPKSLAWKAAPYGFAILALAVIVGFDSQAPAPIQSDGNLNSQLRVMTYNIQQGYSADGQPSFQAQTMVLQREADVIGLQESDTSRVAGGNADTVAYIAKELGMQAYYGPSPVIGTFGIALLSRLPIQNPRIFYMYSQGEQTACITAQVTKAGHTFNIFVTHLGNDGPLIQQDQVLSQTRGLENVVLMGDFNFSSKGEPYQRTLAALADAWLVRWPGKTDANGFSATDEIDHVFVTPGTRVTAVDYLHGPESDHPALMIDIALDQGG
jgi:endonuclease/exonuclease/phosphatase family metal-dependent hydrolase